MPDDDKLPRTRPATQTEPGKPPIRGGQRDADEADERGDDANVGHRLTGNKNAVPPDDEETEGGKTAVAGERPTRDDGDNDDLGELGSDRPGHTPR